MSQVDPDIKALQNAIFRSKVARARQTPISQKLADGALLFDQNMRMMIAAIGSENPEFTDEQIDKEATRRLRIAKRISERGIYRDAGLIDE